MAEVLELGLDIKRMLAELDKLQRRFEKEFPNALDKSEQALDDFEEAGKDAFRKTSSEAEKFGKAVSRLEKRMGGISQQMKTMASSASFLKSSVMGLAGAAGIAGVTLSIRSFIRSGADYEKQISKLNALTKANEDQMLVLRTAIRDVGAQTTFTAQQAAEAANVLASLGRSSEQVSSELKIMVDVATATSTSIEEVAEVVAAQTNVFGISAKVVGDILAGAYATSAANVQRMAVALRQVGPVAKSVGMDFAETAGSVSILVDRGLEASMAGTALRGILTRLIAPTKAVKESMEKMGVSQEKVVEDSKEAASGLSKVGLSFDKIKNLPLEGKLKAIANGLKSIGDQAERDEMLVKIFGVEALAAANILIDEYAKGNDVISKTAEKLREVGDAAGMSKKMTDNLAGSLAILESTVSDKILTAFQAVEPLVKSMVDDMIDFVNGITGQDIVDAVRNIGRTLISAGTAFYNVVAGAINGLMRILQGPELAKVIEAAQGVLDYVLGPSPDRAVEQQKQLIAELEQKVKTNEDTFGGIGNAIKDTIIDGAQAGLEGIGIGDFNLGAFTSGSNTSQLEEARAELKRLEAEAKKVQPTKLFESLTEADTSSYLKTFEEGLGKYEKRLVKMDEIRAERRKKEEEVAAATAAATAATGGTGGTGSSAGTGGDSSGMTEEQKKMWEEVNKAKAELIALTAEENRLLADQAGAHAVILERVKIETEQFAKPALLQQQLADNTDRLASILNDNNSIAGQFVELQNLQLEIQKQYNAASKEGFAEQSNALAAQRAGIEALQQALQGQMVAEAKTSLEQQRRLEFSEDSIRLIQEAQAIGDSALTVEKKFAELNKVSLKLQDMENREAADMTVEKRAQLDSLWQALRLEEERLAVMQKQAEIPLSKTLSDFGANALGPLGTLLENPNALKEVASGVMDQGTSFAIDPTSAAGGPQMAVVNAILQLIQKLEIFQTIIDLVFGNFIRLLDALFSPFTKALDSINSALQPVLDAIGELSTVLVEAFTPLKPFVALVRGIFKVLATALKAVATALKPLTNAMTQVANVISSIFGGTGSFENTVEDMTGALSTVRDALQDLKFSDMNPADSITKLEEATAKYDELRQKAFGDGATEEDINKFTQFAKDYLSLSKAVNKSSSAYADDFNRVSGDLEGLEGKLSGMVGDQSGDDPLGLGSFLEKLWEWLEGLIEKIATAVIDTIRKLLQGAFSIIKWIYDKVVEVLEGAFKGTINIISQFISIVVDAIKRGFQGSINFLSHLLSIVRSALINGFSGAINFLQNLYDAVMGAIQRGFEGYINFLKDFYETVWNVIVEGFSGYINWLEDFYTMIWNVVVDGFTGYINWLSDFYTMVWNVVKNGFTGYINWLSNFYSMVWDIVVKGFTGYVNWLSSFYTLVFNVLQNGFSGTISFLGKIAEEIGKVIERGLAGTVSFFSTVVEKVGNFIESGFRGSFDFVATVRDKIIGLLTGGTSILQTIIDKILSALGLKGFSKTIPILPNPFKSFLGGPTNFLELDFAFAKGGRVPSYADGGMAQGPSHQSGMLGLTRQGTPFLFEGDEFILNKKSTKALGPQLLGLLNSVTSKKEIQAAMSGIVNAYQMSAFGSGGRIELRNNGLGKMNLLNLTNPLSKYAGPSSWYFRMSPDLFQGKLNVEKNIFASGGSLLDLQKQTMSPKTPFGSNARFNVSGNLSGNSWNKDLINISNPLTYVASEIDRWVKNWLNPFEWIWKAIYKNVTKLLGPDRLKLGINGKMLDFWNSRLNANFGGDVLNKLGFGSLPTPSAGSISFSNGGLVNGLPHSMGGRMAELEGGEYVINKRAAQSYGYANLSAINSGRPTNSDVILQRISQKLEELARPQIEVHVYTDMKGEARAEINKFRYELKQKAERAKFNPTEKYIPVTAI